MSRIPIIAANRKMNMGPKETKDFLAAFKSEMNCDGKPICKPVNVVIVSPFVTDTLNDCICVGVGAQDVSDLDNGAFTDEISTAILNELGCRYVVVGHNERRRYHGESNAYIGRKIKKVFAAGICPFTASSRRWSNAKAVTA